MSDASAAAAPVDTAIPRPPMARHARRQGKPPGIGSMLRDVHGQQMSWKRVMSAIALVLYAIGFLAATFLGKSPPEYMMHDLVLLAGGGSLLALLERLKSLGGPEQAGAK